MSRTHTKGFSLIEVMLALGLLVYIILNVSNTQSGAIFFSQYTRNLMIATNLARSKMSDVELLSQQKSMKDLTSLKEEGKFKEYPDFTYSVKVQNTKLKIPIPKQIIESNPMMKQLMQYFEKELFAEVLVEVSWPDGKHKKTISVRRLLANWDFIANLESMAGAM